MTLSESDDPSATLLQDYSKLCATSLFTGQRSSLDFFLQVYLPAVDTAVTQVAAPELPMPQGKGCVLLVDDEETVALAMRFLLESLGYDVVVHTRSPEALEAFRADPDRFDVVITDQTMPQMMGEDFIHALRRFRPELPVILCTGFSHVMDAQKAQALGQVTFLMKPVDAYELGVLLQQLLVHPSKSP